MLSVTFVCAEYFGWGGFYGGFGALTKTLAENLVKKGVEVHVLTQKRVDRKMQDHGEINGVKIHSFNPKIKVRLGLKMREPPELPDTQIFHSQAANRWHNFFVERRPDAVHLVTEQDPRPLRELKECYFPLYPEMRSLKWRLKFEAAQILAKRLAQNADKMYVQARYIADKTKRMFNLSYVPPFLPNPVSMPKRKPKKSTEPTVLFLGRWDPIKRPDIMLQVAEKMPNVQFVCCGVANPQFKSYSAPLVEKAQKLGNVSYLGYVQGEKKNEVLSGSWILLNASSRECLPVSFLEAAANGMAIVSPNDPDGFASLFGKKIVNGEDANEYVSAINGLLQDDLWTEKGGLAKTYVEENHELNRVIAKHLAIYDLWVALKQP